MHWSSKVVLVTGGTGTFGRKFVEIMLRDYHPKALRIFSRDEFKQHEMRRTVDHPSLRYLIGDVRDRERLYRAMDEVDIVVHAAALKQVPACEYNPFEAVKTNILGAQNVIEAAIDRGVERVLAVSTDKAVNPVNLYGATKLCAEKLFVQGNSYAGARNTHLSVARYGNVMGSRGSIVPLFIAQRKDGQVTITDTRMTRFWITIEQGIEFVIRCIRMTRGGEIFVPKIPSIRVIDLAEAIAPGCQHQIIGIRPGEKIHEVLLASEEVPRTLEYDDFFLIKPEYPWRAQDIWEGGRPLADGFQYSSDSNSQWLTVEDLRRMVEARESWEITDD